MASTAALALVAFAIVAVVAIPLCFEKVGQALIAALKPQETPLQVPAAPSPFSYVPPKTLEEVLESPVANAIWQMGRVFEILDLAECEQEANDNEIQA